MTNGKINNPACQEKLDWKAVERFYLYDPSRPSFKQLAEKYGVTYLTVHKHATRRDWVRQRALLDEKLHAKALEQLLKVNVRERILRLRRLARVIDNALDDAAVNPGEMIPQVLKLIQVEREITEGLTPHQSRDRILREHVERALMAGGVLIQEIFHASDTTM